MRHFNLATLVIVAVFAATNAFGQGRGFQFASTSDGPASEADRNSHAIFIEFDRVYIPALALTNQGKPAAQQALRRLRRSWNSRFVMHFHQMYQKDLEWSEDISRMAQCLGRAETKLVSGESTKAHEALEPIREILMEARLRNDVDYPLDLLSQFHATMETIVKPAMGMDAASLDRNQIVKFTKRCQQADKEWHLVEKAKFNLTVFGKSEQEQRHFPAMLKAEREAIRRLDAALVAENKEAIIKAARGLKPPFAKVYMFFGDFPKTEK